MNAITEVSFKVSENCELEDVVGIISIRDNIRSRRIGANLSTSFEIMPKSLHNDIAESLDNNFAGGCTFKLKCIETGKIIDSDDCVANITLRSGDKVQIQVAWNEVDGIATDWLNVSIF